MKISYFKTQWWRLLFAAICFGAAVYFALQPAPDTSTLAGANEVTGYMFSSVCWIITSFFWFAMSIIDWFGERLNMLEAEKERNDAMFKLVQELLEANKIDREIDKAQEEKIAALQQEILKLRLYIKE